LIEVDKRGAARKNKRRKKSEASVPIALKRYQRLSELNDNMKDALRVKFTL
jgi:hypothetical protein